MRRTWSRPALARATAGLAAGLVVMGIGALLFSHLAAPTPGATIPTPDAAADACLSPPATWDPAHASPAQIASYGLPRRPPDSDPTAVARWLDIVAHAKHRVCETGQPGNPVPALPSAEELASTAYIEFAPGTSYPAALRSITDLGLALAGLPCPDGVAVVSGKDVGWHAWVPLARSDGFADQPALTVFATPLAPSDWLHAALAARGVRDVRTDLIAHCPMIVARTPITGTLLALGASQPLVYAQVTFGAGVSYDAALFAMSNLGLRLADPCREHMAASGRAAVWQPAGQEAAFAATHTLVLASSAVASTQWQAQAQALPGVTAVVVAPALTCP